MTTKYKCTGNGEILSHAKALEAYAVTDQETKEHYGCFENWQASNDCLLDRCENRHIGEIEIGGNYFGVYVKDFKIGLGTYANAGMSGFIFSIDYDVDFSEDENLQSLIEQYNESNS